MKNTLTRGLAIGAAGVLTLLSAGPAAAADVVAQAEASAISAVVLGESADSGTVRATHDGQSETVTGSSDPALPLGAGQDSVALGVLAQEATADVVDGEGVSRACAGVAGDGGSVVEIGDTGCITPGNNASLSLASLGDLGSLLSFGSGDAPSLDSLPLPPGLLEQLELPGADTGDASDDSSDSTESDPPVDEIPGAEELAGADSQAEAPEDEEELQEQLENLDQSVTGGGDTDGAQAPGGANPLEDVTDAVTENAAFVPTLELPGGAGLAGLLGGEGQPDSDLAGLLDLLGNPDGNPLADAFGEAAPGDLTGLGLELRLGAIEAFCRADAGGAAGDSRITEADVVLTGVPGGDVVLATLPVEPEPNQKVVTDLSGVVDDVLDGLRTNLNDSLRGALSELEGPVDQLQEQVVNAVLEPLEAQLGPVEENLLDITLNAQSSPEPGAIRVIALQAEVLPAAETLGAPTVVDLAIGDVLCGPNSVIGTDGGPAPAPEAPADIPTAVSAGENMNGVADGNGALVFGGLLALAGAGALGGMAVRNRRA